MILKHLQTTNVIPHRVIDPIKDNCTLTESTLCLKKNDTDVAH